MPTAAPLTTEALDGKIAAGDWDGMEAEARSLVERILNMPLAQAEENRDALARAVAALDLKPLAGSAGANEWKAAWARLFSVYRPAFLKAPALDGSFQKAREGTVRFIALKDAMRLKIPNGWLEDIRKNTTPEIWNELEALHTQWLKDFPAHPLADLVKLSQVRLSYLRDRADESWKALFALYAKRPIRAVGEMRFLLQKRLRPTRPSCRTTPSFSRPCRPGSRIRRTASGTRSGRGCGTSRSPTPRRPGRQTSRCVS
jgi:hypothetical protein